MTQTPTTPGSAIHTRTILVWLRITGWAARKYDKAATAQIVQLNHATGDAARVNKNLVPADAQAYKTLTQLQTSIRAEHYKKALAWTDEGWRLLPTASYLDYTQWFRDVSRQFDDAKREFAYEYPIIRASAPTRLNGLYRAADFPATDDVLARFTLGVEFAPVPAVGDIRVDLGSDQVALIESHVTTRVQAATATAMHDAWSRLHGVVSHMAERLSDPKAIFRDTLIENAREVCESLKRLNVTNDPNLETLRARVEDELTNMTPDSLRDIPSLRAETATKADDIISAMSGLYQVQA